MHYLITGGTGFIGKNLVDYVLTTDSKITLAVRNKREIEECGWKGLLNSVVFDLDDIKTDDLWGYFGEPDCVFHLAWQGLPNYDSPFHLATNLPNQIKFFEKLINSGCPKIITTGTCFEYGRKYGPLKEDMNCSPHNSYAIAKDCLRKVVFELSKDTNTTVIWARLFYLYGKHQREDSLFGQLNQAINNKDKVFRMTQGEQLRDYMDIKDVVKVLYLLSQNVKHPDIINVASGEPISVRKLVENICRQRGANMKLELGYYPYSKFESMAFWADTTKLKKILAGRT